MDKNTKKSKILKYLDGNKFTIQRDFDEFTGKTHIYIEAVSDIIFSDDFEDVDFIDSQEGLKNFAKQKVDSAYQEAYNKLSYSDRQYFPTDRSEDYEKEIQHLTQITKSMSRVNGQLAYIEDSDWKERFILLNFDFKNTSHHRDVNDMKVYLKNAQGSTHCFENSYAVSHIETKSDLFQFTSEYIYHDIVSYALNENDFAFLCDQDVKCSVRFGKLKIPAEVFLTSEMVEYIKFLAHPEDASDEQVDKVYDLVQENIRKDKERDELDKKIEKQIEAEDKLKQQVEKFKAVDFYRFDYAEYIARASKNLPFITTIMKICKDEGIESPIIEFYNNIPNKYDTNFILKDIENKKNLKGKYQRIKNIMCVFGWISAISFFVFSALEYADISTISMLLCIVFIIIQRRYKKKDVYFDEKTVKMIEDFKKELQK